MKIERVDIATTQKMIDADLEETPFEIPGLCDITGTIQLANASKEEVLKLIRGENLVLKIPIYVTKVDDDYRIGIRLTGEPTITEQ